MRRSFAVALVTTWSAVIAWGSAACSSVPDIHFVDDDDGRDAGARDDSGRSDAGDDAAVGCGVDPFTFRGVCCGATPCVNCSTADCAACSASCSGPGLACCRKGQRIHCGDPNAPSCN